MDPSNLRRKLEDLARNLWWTWHSEVFGIFRDLDHELWRNVGHNPILFLKRIDDQQLFERARALALESRIHAAARRLAEYLGERNTWGARYAGMLAAHPVAYFCAEFGLHETLPLYSGGLGVLAGDHLKAASDLDVPVIGIGLFYVLGYFTQRVDRNGWQQEEYGAVDLGGLPLEEVRDDQGGRVEIEVPCGRSTVRATLWRAYVGRNELVLLDTDIPSNEPEHRTITHRLYWGDQSSRIVQEILLGIGGLRAVRALGLRPGVFHLNEGHSAFALLEAIRIEMEENACAFEEAAHRIGSRTVFTTHTPVPAGHDRFPPELVEEHLGWLRQSLGLEPRDFLALGREDPGADHETFCMTVLALKLAHRANAVSSIHADVSRRMWKRLWPVRRVGEAPIGHITNGVHTRSWTSPQLLPMLERHLGLDWAQRVSRSELWQTLEEVSPVEIWETHQILKSNLIEFCRTRYVEQELRRGADPAQAAADAAGLFDQNVLLIAFGRRFATYKRATLLLQDRDRFAALVRHAAMPVQFVFSGKSHPRDDGGKKLIQEIVRLQDEPPFKGRILFIEGYDMNVSRRMVQGADVWLNTPKRPEEACGTSGMKAALNGALNLSMLDGWWAEAYDGQNGFAVPANGLHTDPAVQDRRDLEALYDVLEREVCPLYYARGRDGVPSGWIARMKWALITLGWRFSADRMVMDYVRLAYLPAAHGESARL